MLMVVFLNAQSNAFLTRLSMGHVIAIEVEFIREHTPTAVTPKTTEGIEQKYSRH